MSKFKKNCCETCNFDSNNSRAYIYSRPCYDCYKNPKRPSWVPCNWMTRIIELEQQLAVANARADQAEKSAKVMNDENQSLVDNINKHLGFLGQHSPRILVKESGEQLKVANEKLAENARLTKENRLLKTGQQIHAAHDDTAAPNVPSMNELMAGSESMAGFLHHMDKMANHAGITTPKAPQPDWSCPVHGKDHLVCECKKIKAAAGKPAAPKDKEGE